MKFEIKSATNGFILKCEDDGELYVHQEADDVEVFADFLRLLCDAYGPISSRYEAQRIYVIVQPGDKHPDYNGCPECGEHTEFNIPCRSPLTGDQISTLNDKYGWFEFGDAQGNKTLKFVRAVEAMHEILPEGEL